MFENQVLTIVLGLRGGSNKELRKFYNLEFHNLDLPNIHRKVKENEVDG